MLQSCPAPTGTWGRVCEDLCKFNAAGFCSRTKPTVLVFHLFFPYTERVGHEETKAGKRFFFFFSPAVSDVSVNCSGYHTRSTSRLWLVDPRDVCVCVRACVRACVCVRVGETQREGGDASIRRYFKETFSCLDLALNRALWHHPHCRSRRGRGKKGGEGRGRKNSGGQTFEGKMIRKRECGDPRRNTLTPTAHRPLIPLGWQKDLLNVLL